LTTIKEIDGSLVQFSEAYNHYGLHS